MINGGNCLLNIAEKKYQIQWKGRPECTNACPAGVNVKSYVNLIANRRFEEAVDIIRKMNPFPGICGRVCTRPCESHCELSETTDPVLIRALKRYAADYELARRPLFHPPYEPIYKEKIAIIGSGPAGLTAAVDLARLGFSVTVFEKEKKPGGMLMYAIPSYRLPKRIVKREIDWITGLGITIQTEKTIKDPTILFDKGYDVVLLAQGASKSFSLGIPGENTECVYDPLVFLKDITIGSPKDVHNKTIIVIGGGSTAFDVARSSKRLGAKNVFLVYRRGFDEMPADREEIEDAKDEGIHIITLAIPKRIIRKSGKVSSVEFLRAKLGEPDESGRRRPVALKDSEFIIDAEIVIPAVGAQPDIDFTDITDEKGRIPVKEDCSTQINGVFAAGDVETGPSSIVDAIGRGHIAARGIFTFLTKAKDTARSKTQQNDIFVPIITESLPCHTQNHIPRKIDMDRRRQSFDEVDTSFYDFEAVEEASRCFSCGSCHSCSTCLPQCTHKQVTAEIDKHVFLLKVPALLSNIVTKKNLLKSKITCDKQTKNITLQSLTPTVNSDLCIACGRCEEVCSYRAIKNSITKNERIIATVDHGQCASCSACVSACPTGAITQGYMSDEKILSRLQRKKTRFDGIKGLISYWDTKNILFEECNGIVEVMDERKISSSFLIKALARSKKGIVIIGSKGKTGSHYLPFEENVETVINDTKKMLKMMGISAERIHYDTISQNKNPSQLLQDFSESIKEKKLKKIDISFPETKMSPIGESMALLRMMSAYNDIKPVDDFSPLPVAKTKDIVYFEGCLPLLHAIGESHHLFDLGPRRKAIFDLLTTVDIHCGTIKELLCPAKGLLNLNIDHAEDIFLEIRSKNKKTVASLKPEKMIIATPEAYQSFTCDNIYGTLLSLPNVLFNSLKNRNDFHQINKTIAIHPVCSLDTDPFYDSTVDLLSLIPGLKTTTLNNSCDHNRFNTINVHQKESAELLIREAEKQGAELIICTSPYCQSHLLMNQRKGSWSTSDVMITDVYQLLIKSINGGII